MRAPGIVKRQQVQAVKVERARELRREMTDEEDSLWQRLRMNRLNGLHFRRQQVIGRFIVDFYCDSAGLVVEVDGPVLEAQSEADAERDATLSAHGLRVLRITNDEVRSDLPGVLVRIALCAEHSPSDLDSHRLRGNAGRGAAAPPW
jgi:very-short-patch-repair endonuclease